MEIKIDKIIRSKRKSISIVITQGGDLIVNAPLGVNERRILEVVEKHSKWIEEKLKQVQQKSAKSKSFVEGEEFLFLGNTYKLYILKNQDEPLVFNNAFYLSKDFQHVGKKIFISWYKKKAYEVISERVDLWAKRHDFNYTNLRITDAQRRWGSCSSKKTLSFSWRLIMAPLEVIDYVVVHELSHLLYPNHGKMFWLKVRSIIPEYELYDNWLKENGYLLNL